MQEHHQPSHSFLSHVAFSICSKHTHPCLLRLASESCIFGRMCVCTVQWERIWKNLVPNRVAYLSSWLAKIANTSRGAYCEIMLIKWSCKGAMGFFSRGDKQSMVSFCFSFCRMGWKEDSFLFRVWLVRMDVLLDPTSRGRFLHLLVIP